MTMNRLFLRTTAVAAGCALLLAGCSKDDKADDTATATTTATATSTMSSTTTAKATTTASETTTVAASGLTAENFHLHDGFVKAVPADAGMTAVFGMLENHTDSPAHLVGFSTNLDASTYEIHEVVDGKMQEKQGGIVVEPDSHVMLKPGGDHLMIMGLKQAVEAGSTIEVTLKFADGSTVVIPDVPVRTLGAGEEDYAGGHEGMNHDHDHSGEKH